jgi:dUTP pyrophosphatase
VELKVKLEHPEAKLPLKATIGSAGFDLFAVSEKINIEDRYIEYSFGLSLEIPNGYVGLIFPRSSITKKDILLGNAVGVIDSDFRGEITARFKNLLPVGARKYKVGERIAQLVVMKLPDELTIKQVDQLDQTERGASGYGSSGN